MNLQLIKSAGQQSKCRTNRGGTDVRNMGEKLLLSSRQLIQIKLVPVPKSFPAKNHDWNNKAICQKKQIDNYRHNLENISDLNISFMPLYFDRSLNNCVLNANEKVRPGLQLDLIYNMVFTEIQIGKTPPEATQTQTCLYKDKSFHYLLLEKAEQE